MLKVYTSYNCTSCKKTMEWLNSKGISYEEYNFFSKDLNFEELKYILKYSENGFEDIISERSKIFHSYKDVINDFKTTELIDFIIERPSILKRPILVDDVTASLIIGFNEQEMENIL